VEAKTAPYAEPVPLPFTRWHAGPRARAARVAATDGSRRISSNFIKFSIILMNFN
jgi:hypothetical protein